MAEHESADAVAAIAAELNAAMKNAGRVGADDVTPEKAAFELRYWLDTRTETDRLGRDVGIVLDELAAANARAAKAQTQLDTIGLLLPVLAACLAEPRRDGGSAEHVAAAISSHWQPAPNGVDATGPALSATLTADDGSHSSATPEGPQKATPCRSCGETYCDDSREARP